MVLQTGLCLTWSETPKTGFLTTRLKLSCPNLPDMEKKTLIKHFTTLIFLSVMSFHIVRRIKCIDNFSIFRMIKKKKYTTQNLIRAKLLILFAGGPAYLIPKFL